MENYIDNQFYKGTTWTSINETNNAPTPVKIKTNQAIFTYYGLSLQLFIRIRRI